MSKIVRHILIVAGLLGTAFAVMEIMAVRRMEPDDIDDGNPYEINDTMPSSKYERYLKPAIGKILSFFALVALSPLFAVITVAIKIDDPGPVFFTQTRVGKDGHFFALHKFRSMKMSTPSEVPTHELKDPDQYITRVGHFLRKTSLDEIPQFWDAFRGRIAIVSPRPALWNQADLVEERQKNGSISIKPGITGAGRIIGTTATKPENKAFLALCA